MEIPCVATWIMGVPELIKDGIDGLLVTPSNAEDLAQAIARLMDDAELRLQIGQQARRRVQERFDLRTNAVCLGTRYSRGGWLNRCFSANGQRMTEGGKFPRQAVMESLQGADGSQLIIRQFEPALAY